jgi:hypothetical protein
MAKRWSDEENAVLREVWKTAGPLENSLDRFPGRTMHSIYKQAAKLDLASRPRPEPATLNRIAAVLGDNKPRTAVQIADEIKTPEHRVRVHLATLIERKQVFVLSYEGPYQSAIFMIGNGENAELPAAVAHKKERLKDGETMRRALSREQEIAQERRRDEEYRDQKCEWWPHMDHELESVFINMVRGPQVDVYRTAA